MKYEWKAFAGCYKTELRARQISPRSGDLWCRLRGGRVDISGYAVTYAAGELRVGSSS